MSNAGWYFSCSGIKKNKDGEIINADGVQKEFDIAVNKKKYVFPIGATGYKAKELADLVLSDFEKYNGCMPNIKAKLQELNTPHLSKDKIISSILSIIDILSFKPELR